MSVSEVGVIARQAAPGQFWPAVRKGFAAHGIYLLIAAVYFAAFQVSGYLNPKVVDKETFEILLGILGFSLPIAVMCMLIIQFYHVAAIDKSATPTKDLWKRMKGVFTHRDTMARGIPMYVAVLLFMYSFTIIKSNISNYVPFSWDQTFDTWDVTLHFGSRPYEWLMPALGNELVTFAVNFNYNCWFIIMKTFWVYFAFIHAPGVERTRFWLSFMLIWSLGGSLLAIYFSSVGPCFYGLLLDGPDPYEPLMTHLRTVHQSVPVWALAAQDFLWQFRVEQSALGGVTAMPSMHNATALLFVLVTWNWGKYWRAAMISHAVLIYLGSIYLGWHYAVDSYLAWAITLVLWLVSGRLARWWNAKPLVASFNAEHSAVYSR